MALARDERGQPIDFAALSEHPPDATIPYLDRREIDETGLTAQQAAWRRDGLLILPGFIPDEVTQPYIRARASHKNLSGWLTGSAYMHVLELRDLGLYPPLMAVLQSLIGEKMLLKLCLTAWVSTERDWHQDDYLNPPFVNTWYAAAWIALGDIHPDSGPFEYVRGSHKWPVMRGEKVRRFLTEEERCRRSPETGIHEWPTYAERFTTPAIEAEIRAQQKDIVPFLGKRGDVLIWHSRLMHRGGRPGQPGMERRAVITHYSGEHHRPDMVTAKDQNGELYAVLDYPLLG